MKFLTIFTILQTLVITLNAIVAVCMSSLPLQTSFYTMNNNVSKKNENLKTILDRILAKKKAEGKPRAQSLALVVFHKAFLEVFEHSYFVLHL